MIDKGEPARAEMDQAIADKAAGLFKREGGGTERRRARRREGGDEKEGTGGRAVAGASVTMADLF